MPLLLFAWVGWAWYTVFREIYFEGGDRMAQTTMELRVAQKRQLYTLLTIKKLNEGTKIRGLDAKINETEAEMEQEDVALVKEKINELTE
jgi:hypothetical protein